MAFNSGAVSSFWAVDGFTYDLTTSVISDQGGAPGSGHVTVDGFGTISGNGFDSTPGSWHFTTQDPSADAQFSFSAATGAVPEGGSTVLFFGMGLVGVAGLRRMVRVPKA